MIVDQNTDALRGVEINGSICPEFSAVLTNEAISFIAKLHRKFNERRLGLLEERVHRQKEIDQGNFPNFLEETAAIRQSEWVVAPLPNDLKDRRVEITGPVDRKMIINALNSGASVFMADFEDSNSPTWDNVIGGQINLRDAVDRSIQYTHPVNGKHYQLNDEVATLMVRPRGWHLNEKHVTVDGVEMSGALFDFGLFFYHNANKLIQSGSGPYFYLPKLESHLEARLWNDVFVFAQDMLGIEQGTIKATVLIETITAAFEMDEILYELKAHSAGLNCGRWDYIFSYIKKFRNHAGFIVPDRGQVGMTTPFMRAYSLLVIKTCHRRNVHAMGGMAAQIPIKNDEAANREAIDKVICDKEREVKDGHDGTWVAHPALVPIAKKVFDRCMPTRNQIHVKRAEVSYTAAQLIEVPQGTITEEGLRQNINVGILYIESWLRGVGAAALYHLMEDAATAEISRTQIWQWIRHEASLEDGRKVTFDLYRTFLPEELDKIRKYVGEENYVNGRFEEAVRIFESVITGKDFKEFLTLPAYRQL